MRGSIRVLLLGVLLLAVDSAEARQWASRDGRFTVEAELLTVEAGQVVLRRESGSVVRVPLERLSLGDVKYVQETLQAGGLTSPPSATPPASAASVPKEVPKSASVRVPSPQVKPEPKAPPLARPGRVKWQAAPDPARQGYGLLPDATVGISVPMRHSRPFVLYPSSPSPFVVLGNEEKRGVQELWDLRTGKTIGEIDVGIDSNNKIALSPDGQHLAFNYYKTPGEVRIWSFSARKVVQSLALPDRHSQVGFMGFSGSRRMVVGESKVKTYLVYDLQSGQRCGAVDVEPERDDGSQALSPGGNYLVVYSGTERVLAIYDTRNGVRAGRLDMEIEKSMRPACLIFSADGQELAGWFRHDSGFVVHVWDMSNGKCVLTHRFPQDPNSRLVPVRYRGVPFQWLADRSGWLLSGVGVVDRVSGQIVWQDQEAIDGRDVLPRRIVDGDRMLVFREEANRQTLYLTSIPQDAIAKSRAIVEAGGTADDVGLPPVTEAERQGAKDLTLTHAPWAYRAPAPSPPSKAELYKPGYLGEWYFNRNKAIFSRPDAARIAIGENLESSKRTWKTMNGWPQACRLFDLRSGEQVGRFEIPFPTELLDLSPEGKLGLFRIDQGKDRLDIWDLESGEHVLGFRPYEGAIRDRRVAWAGFIDENHVVTVSESEKVAAWELSECRAVWASQPGYGQVAGTTRNRHTMVVMSGRAPHFVDALSGKVIGTLPTIGADQVVSPRASFSSDENRLAVLFSRNNGCTLATWDLTDGSMLMKLEFPFDAYGLVWCGPDHILLDRSLESGTSDTIIDVGRGLVVWDYEIARGTAIWSSPDHRFWFLDRSHSAASSELAAVELPDQEVKTLLSQVQMPDPLIGPGATVTVQTQIADPLQSIPPGWPELENLDRGLLRHFSGQLQERHVDVVAGGGTRLIVGIEQVEPERTISMPPRPSWPGSRPQASTTLLIPFAAVFDSNSNRVWAKKPSADEMRPMSYFDCPEGTDKVVYAKLQQWKKAADWLRAVEIPNPLFHPGTHRGMGESVITPEKMEIRRSPSPTQMKPPGKTVRVLTGRAAQPS